MICAVTDKKYQKTGVLYGKTNLNMIGVHNTTNSVIYVGVVDYIDDINAMKVMWQNEAAIETLAP